WRIDHQNCGKPWSSSTSGPSPISATWKRMPFALISRWIHGPSTRTPSRSGPDMRTRHAHQRATPRLEARPSFSPPFSALAQRGRGLWLAGDGVDVGLDRVNGPLVLLHLAKCHHCGARGDECTGDVDPTNDQERPAQRDAECVDAERRRDRDDRRREQQEDQRNDDAASRGGELHRPDFHIRLDELDLLVNEQSEVAAQRRDELAERSLTEWRGRQHPLAGVPVGARRGLTLLSGRHATLPLCRLAADLLVMLSAILVPSEGRRDTPSAIACVADLTVQAQ